MNNFFKKKVYYASFILLFGLLILSGCAKEKKLEVKSEVNKLVSIKNISYPNEPIDPTSKEEFWKITTLSPDEILLPDYWCTSDVNEYAQNFSATFIGSKFRFITFYDEKYGDIEAKYINYYFIDVCKLSQAKSDERNDEIIVEIIRFFNSNDATEVNNQINFFMKSWFYENKSIQAMSPTQDISVTDEPLGENSTLYKSYEKLGFIEDLGLNVSLFSYTLYVLIDNYVLQIKVHHLVTEEKINYLNESPTYDDEDKIINKLVLYPAKIQIKKLGYPT